MRDAAVRPVDSGQLDGIESRRRVEPHRLVAAGRRWYLLAYDTDRDDWRIFRVDRMRDLVRTGGRVGARELPGSDPADYVASKLFDSAPTYRARVTLRERLRGWWEAK